MNKLSLSGAALVVLLATGVAHALTIDTKFLSTGSSIPTVGAVTGPPSSALGGGDLESLVRAAADEWERLILDDHKFTLTFGWADTSLWSNAAVHIPGGSGGRPSRTIAGSIAFNSSANNSLKMFLDPTPSMNEEFTFEHRKFTDLGSGPIEYSRQFVGFTPESKSTIDLYTTALHEIGHALGLTSWETYLIETLDGDIDVTLAPFEGSSIPVHSSHIELSESLLADRRMWGQRREITQTDLLAVCQINGFNQCQLELAPADYAGDLNGDGAVNAADYTVWRDNLDAASRSSDASTVPTDFSQWAKNFGRTFQTNETFAGDYNADGVVNAADYTIYRDALASGDLSADGDGDGKLTTADWTYWTERYGAKSTTLGGSVPEPSTVAMVVFAVAAMTRRRSR